MRILKWNLDFGDKENVTRNELKHFMDVSDSSMSLAFMAAKKEMPSIKEKQFPGNGLEVSYTLEEILCIARNFYPPLNEIQIEIIKDAYIPHSKTFLRKRSQYIEGTEKFLERYADPKKRKTMKCCASCAYLRGRTILCGTTKLFPYCSFYEKFLFTVNIKKRGKMVKADIFKDKCKTYIRTQTDIIRFKR